MVLNGDCLEQLKNLEDNSIDSVVTDPPYGLAFMGKHWDYDVPSVEIWKEVLRVLKPGGHLLSFGGTRTYHRMVVNIEDAGFEIRDQIMWVYGSGFPKSHNLDGRWKGWGTALKPANEPICLARKPISEKTVASNVLKHGTGAMNIDESRIEGIADSPGTTPPTKNGNERTHGDMTRIEFQPHAQGRWPANIIFDEEAGKILNIQQDDVARFFYCAKTSKSERGDGNVHPTVKPIKLMAYLIKLITPPGGVVLDPFMGSGTTGIAAKGLGFDFVGIERDPEYFKIASKRIESGLFAG